MGWIIVCGIIACITVCVVILAYITEKKAREQVLMLQMQQIKRPYLHRPRALRRKQPHTR